MVYATPQKKYLLCLKSRGLLMERQSGDYYWVTMHDVIHDLALSVASFKYKTVDSDKYEYDERIQHLSLTGKDFSRSSLLKIKKQLQSLLVLWTEGGRPELLNLTGLSKLECLRVLSLQDVGLEDVPRTIGKMIHLKYLDLSGNPFRVLPKEITQLVNLLYLSVSWCKKLRELPQGLSKLVHLESLDIRECTSLLKLPRDMCNLVKLRHLLLGGCTELRHMPLGLRKLMDLQRLDLFIVRGQSLNLSSTNSSNPNESDDDDNIGALVELNCLNNLEGGLRIVVMDGSCPSESEIRAENLQRKEKLTKLSITFEGGFR